MRIFTPYAELPFAGHPSVGAAHTLVRTGRLPAGTLRQECGVGVLDLVVDDDGATLTGGSPSLGGARSPEALAVGHGAVAVRRRRRARAPGRLRPAVHLPGRAPGRRRPRGPGHGALDGLGVGEGVSVLSWDAATSTAYARVFAGDLHWDEDPATGSAALGTGVWLVATGLLAADGTSSYVVRQGEKMGRPSVLTCTVTASGGKARRRPCRAPSCPIASRRIRIP